MRSAPGADRLDQALATRILTCSACGQTHAEATWRGLPLRERIEAMDVRRLVSGWPDGLCVEVRGCSRCGKSIAAKRPA
jgi:hypothetical protein